MHGNIDKKKSTHIVLYRKPLTVCDWLAWLAKCAIEMTTNGSERNKIRKKTPSKNLAMFHKALC